MNSELDEKLDNHFTNIEQTMRKHLNMIQEVYEEHTSLVKNIAGMIAFNAQMEISIIDSRALVETISKSSTKMQEIIKKL